MQNELRVINIMPTWQSLVPVIEAAFNVGDEEAKEIARSELLKMAKAADWAVNHLDEDQS